MVGFFEFLDGLYGILLYILAFVELMFLSCVREAFYAFDVCLCRYPRNNLMCLSSFWIRQSFYTSEHDVELNHLHVRSPFSIHFYREPPGALCW